MSHTNEKDSSFARFATWIVRVVQGLFHRHRRMNVSEDQGIGFRYNQP